MKCANYYVDMVYASLLGKSLFVACNILWKPELEIAQESQRKLEIARDSQRQQKIARDSQRFPEKPEIAIDSYMYLLSLALHLLHAILSDALKLKLFITQKNLVPFAQVHEDIVGAWPGMNL